MKLGELRKEPSTCFPACGPNLAHFYLRRYEIGGGKRISQHLSSRRSVRAMTRKPRRVLVRDQDLFWAQKIEGGMTAGARIDDGREVGRKVVGITAVLEWECKRQ